MAKQINVGVGGVVKKVKEVPIGIGGVVKKAKKGVCGIGGVVKEFFTSNPLTYAWKWESSSYVRDKGDYIAFYSGTETSGRGTGVLISGINGHVITVKIGADTSSPRIWTFYSWNSSEDRVDGPSYEYSGTSAKTITIDCTSGYTDTGILWIFVSASKGWDYHFRIYDILVDGDSVMESFREWAT